MSTAVVSRVPPFPVRQFTLDEYHRMIATGVLEEDDPVELLEGWVVPKMPRTPRHDAVIHQIHDLLRERLPAGWTTRIQSALTTEDSEPEPDLAVVRGPASRYLERHPGSADAALVIEVAESSLARDRDAKLAVYARAGVAAYWIVNLVDSRLEVHIDPAAGAETPRYRRVVALAPGDEVNLSLGGQGSIRIDVRELLPRA